MFIRTEWRRDNFDTANWVSTSMTNFSTSDRGSFIIHIYFIFATPWISFVYIYIAQTNCKIKEIEHQLNGWKQLSQMYLIIYVYMKMLQADHRSIDSKYRNLHIFIWMVKNCVCEIRIPGILFVMNCVCLSVCVTKFGN